MVQGLRVKHLKTTSKWILEESLVVHASFLALQISYEEGAIDLILWPGEGSECAVHGRLWEDRQSLV